MSEKFKRILDTFAEKIGYVRRGPMGVPRMIEIDLSIAVVDLPYTIAGNLFYIWSAPDRDDYINIKVNQTSQPAISYRMGQGLKTPFDKLVITTPAGQTGTMYLIFGTEAPELLEIIDNRAALSGDISSLLAELQGDTVPENWGTEITVGNAAAVQILAANANRKACSIQAKGVNVGIVYIGFDNTVATNKWIAELQAGMSFTVDDYRGDLYARADAVGQLVGYGEW